MSFNFGNPKTTPGGFNLTNTATNPLAPSPAVGAGDAKPQAKPLFGALPTAAAPAFSFGGTPATSTPKPAPGFGFGGGGAPPQTAAIPAFNLAAPTTTTAAAPAGGGFSFGSNAPATAASSVAAPLNFGAPAPATAAPSLSFGAVTSAAAAPAPAAATTAAPLQFNLSSTTTPSTTISTSFTPLFGSATTTTVSSLAGLTTTSTAAAPLKLSASLPTATAAPTLSLTTSAASQAITAPTSAAPSLAAAVPSNALTYAQLEDSINKWTVDLEEQGKFFINQAKQLNAWDTLLISNSDKILGLNDTIERVKRQQKQLDQELDFVMAQQNELEELSAPLEKQLADIPITDQNRFQMYQLSEFIDSQLKQMSEDLKEVVENLNESNKNEDVSDPVIQVKKILNAHMNSLQWIDRNTTQITSHLDQISKMQELHKQSHLNF